MDGTGWAGGRVDGSPTRPSSSSSAARACALGAAEPTRAVEGRRRRDGVGAEVDVLPAREQVERRLLHAHVRLDAEEDGVSVLVRVEEAERVGGAPEVACGLGGWAGGRVDLWTGGRERVAVWEGIVWRLRADS